MKTRHYPNISLTVALTVYVPLLVPWLFSEESNPFWIKHVAYGASLALITLIFLIFGLSPKAKTKTDMGVIKSEPTKLEFQWFYIVPTLMTLTLIAVNILTSTLALGAKIAVIVVTYGLLTMIALTYYLLRRRNVNDKTL